MNFLEKGENPDEEFEILQELNVLIGDVSENEDPGMNVLLQEWGLPELVADFKKKNIDIECLKGMIITDINDIIPPEKIGLRNKFRTKLFEWRATNGYSTPLAETLSQHNSSLVSWLTTSDTTPNETREYRSASGSDSPLNATQNIDVRDVLQQSLSGNNILEEYEKRSQISKKSRNEICTLISEYWLNKNYRRITSETYKKAVEQICKIFPTETEEAYINLNKKEDGKLVQRFYNLSRKYRKRGVIESTYTLKKRKNSDTKENDPLAILLEGQPDEEAQQFYMWLKKGASVGKDSDKLIKERWIRTHNLRMSHIAQGKDVFLEWPLLKQSIAISLISEDFEILHPAKELLLFAKWEDFDKKILKIYQRDIADCTSKKFLDKLQIVHDPDVRQYIIFSLLPAILIPTIIHEKSEGKNIVWKPSILEAQSSLAFHVQVQSNLLTTIQNHREKLTGKGLTNHPLIIPVGDLDKKFTDIYVEFNTTLYRVDNFLKAITLTFKLFYVFNLEYPKVSKLQWEFVQNYIYELPLPRKNNAITTLISELDSLA